MPLVMPIIALLLTMYVPSEQDFFLNTDCLYAMPVQSKSAVLWMFLIFCLITPGLSFIIMKQTGYLKSIEMNEQRERDLPILTMLTYCLLLYFVFYTKIGNSTAPKFIFSLPLSGVFVTLIFYFLNRWKKLSIHAAGAGILVGFVLAYILFQTEYQMWVLALSILLSGLVISARLYLKKHDFQEVILGWLVGCFVTFGVNMLY